MQAFTAPFKGQEAGQPTLAVAQELPKLKESHVPPAYQVSDTAAYYLRWHVQYTTACMLAVQSCQPAKSWTCVALRSACQCR